MEWGAYLLVASKESKVQLLDITTCRSKGALVQAHKHAVNVQHLSYMSAGHVAVAQVGS